MEDRQIRISVFPGFLGFSCVNPEKQTAERTCSISAELRPDAIASRASNKPTSQD